MIFCETIFCGSELDIVRAMDLLIICVHHTFVTIFVHPVAFMIKNTTNN